MRNGDGLVGLGGGAGDWKVEVPVIALYPLLVVLTPVIHALAAVIAFFWGVDGGMARWRARRAARRGAAAP